MSDDAQVGVAFDFGAVSDVGLVRGNNEDAGYCSRNLLAVADGVAGGPAGEVASSLVIDVLRGLRPVSGSEPDDPRWPLLQQVERAHDRVAGAVETDRSLTGMATTLTAVLAGRSGRFRGVEGGELGLVHVGDSRLYLFHAWRLFPMTRDHSFPQLLVEQGRITPAEAEHHPQRSVIVRSLSADRGVQPDVILLLALVGQRLLLCSDGLSDYVPLERLSELLPQGAPQESAEALLDEALRRGSRDNVTVVVADVVRDDALPPAEQILGAAAESSSYDGSRRVG
jgi:PPM family protein phosphatase